MKTFFLIFFFFLFVSNSYAQEARKKIFFLADTTNISKANMYMEIKWVDVFEQSFIFFCKCAPPYRSYVTFSYINKKGNKKAEIVSRKPNYPYISFKELMDMSAEWYNFFDNKYDLYITETLPGNKYRTNKVRFVPPSLPTQDHAILNEKQ
ncbi:hypothetical protein [Pedobacter endophyticus]|uniref:GLPGLI family protein n=1 Tax=Pedobacter endophyticus TaxID=2789740 RepID=A0A7S9Q0S8_9SPHI|nr:hypothetical protein [Pedobacter endophyticus]QPH41285.1 hypothetical protein IZT61_08530 [Pedobacter endophyticus]